MKGAIFICLNDLVESQYGLDVWEELLEEVAPVCGGVYTSTEDYPDQEAIDFILAISRKLELPAQVATRSFGHYLFSELNSKYPIFSQLTPSFVPFVKSIESVIHKEVRKLYDNPSLPHIECEEINPKEIQIRYQSPRKLCFLAEGLFFGAAEHFNEHITIDHTACMHDGAGACEMTIKLNDA